MKEGPSLSDMVIWPIVRKHRLLSGMATALVIGLIICLAAGLNFFHSVRSLLSDQMFRAASLQGASPAANDIVIVTIDDQSLATLGDFSSWPRSYHAELVNDLNADGARLIVFDLLFSETTSDDPAFAAAMAKAGDVILPYAYSQVSYDSTAAGRSVSLENKIMPCPALAQQALALGNAVMLPDQDGIVRRVPLYLGSRNNPQASLALVAVAKYLRRPNVTDGPIENDKLPLAGREIPVDAYGNMLLNYTDGASGARPFTEVSYSDVLAGKVSPGVFQGKIVLIGVTATGLGDIFWTPLGQVMHGVELHATAMETILADRFLQPVPLWGDLLIIIFMALAAGALIQKLRIPWAVTAVVGLVIVYVVVAVVGFEDGLMLDLLFPPLAVVAAAGGANVMQVLCEQAEKRDIEKTFGRYVSPEVAGRILKAEQDTLGLRGDSREITALYADARNFTTLMESHTPEMVFQSLNIYMKAIIASIQHHGGIVNKFTGDGVLAFWNAPLEMADHAAMAVRAALTCQRAILQTRDSGEVELSMEFGIGIMTGTTYVGTMGTRDRLEYTVLGDAVNTASRLCGLAQGGQILIGEETYRRLDDRFKVTEVGEKMLKGRQHPLNVYEVLEDGGDVNIP